MTGKFLPEFILTFLFLQDSDLAKQGLHCTFTCM